MKHIIFVGMKKASRQNLHLLKHDMPQPRSQSLSSYRPPERAYKVWTLFVQSRHCPCKVDIVRTKCEYYLYKVVVVLAKLTLFVQSVKIIRTKLSLSLQSCRCSYKVDIVRTKLLLSLQSWHCSYKVVVVLCTKLTLFAQSFVQRKLAN